jgi:hypothetical protein
MSVNTIGGLPVFEVFADNTIIGGKYNSGDFVITGNKVGIGTTGPTNKLTIYGDNTNPSLKLENHPTLGTSARVGAGYIPININGTTKYIAYYN